MIKWQKHFWYRIQCKLCSQISNFSSIPQAKVDSYISVKIPKKYQTHKARLDYYFAANDSIEPFRSLLPEKCLVQRNPNDQLYLIDPAVAKVIASHVIPKLNEITDFSDHIVADCNPGFGFIGKELLDEGVESIRFYEPTPEFKEELEKLKEAYSERVEIFDKDMFKLHSYSYLDRFDNGDRVEQLLINVPRKSWNSDPVMTIIGPSINNYFLRYLTRTIPTQIGLAAYGRVQFFLMMKPRDYLALSADHLNIDLVNYKYMSVLFNIFYDFEISEKFPRQVFLPWERKSNPRIKRKINQIDEDKMYLVHLVWKKDLPLRSEQLVPFFFFVKQFFNTKTKIIPALETWVPGCGENIIWPKLDHDDYYSDFGIMTEFGDLTPNQLVAVFKEIYEHPAYVGSPFLELIERELAKGETQTNVISSQLERNILEDVEATTND